jgi:hypothetical protein
MQVLILGVDKAGKTNVLERLKTIYTQVGSQVIQGLHASIGAACRGR